MRAQIDGVPAKTHSITFRPNGFGHPVQGEKLHQIVVTMSISDFEKAASEIFNWYSDEIRQDDERYGTQTKELHSIGYPAFSTALREYSRSLGEILVTYLAPELLEALLGANTPAECRYVITSLLSLTIDENNVAILGYCRDDLDPWI